MAALSRPCRASSQIFTKTGRRSVFADTLRHGLQIDYFLRQPIQPAISPRADYADCSSASQPPELRRRDAFSFAPSTLRLTRPSRLSAFLLRFRAKERFIFRAAFCAFRFLARCAAITLPPRLICATAPALHAFGAASRFQRYVSRFRQSGLRRMRVADFHASYFAGFPDFIFFSHQDRAHADIS